MYVAVQHTIRDPEKFWGKAQEILPNLTGNVKLHQCFPNKNGTRGICIWEGESVKAIQTFLDGKVGDVSSNDYFEVENKEAIALPTAIQTPQKSTQFSDDTSRARTQDAPPPA